MRLIEKSLTENIYNALNESFDSDKATKRLARYKKSNRLRMNESAETGKITLKDYAMKFYEGDIDIDVTDTEVDMLVAFVYDFNEEPEDNYDRFLNLLGERTEVVKVGNNVLTCDFSSVFKPYEDKLQDFFNMDYSDFNEAYYEAVSNLEALISGNAGEKTYKELVDILSGKQINESAGIDNDKDHHKFTDMVMELHSYIEAEPGKISRDLKAAIKSNKLEDYLKHSAAMDDEEISNFIKKYSGEINNMNESVDNDPDLDADQVQADIDYWTDVDDANTEDVTDVEPVGVYTVSNNSAIYVYQIEYDIEDRVLVGDSSDETKAKWRDIIYGDGEAYFWYGDIKVPFNDVMKTDM